MMTLLIILGVAVIMQIIGFVWYGPLFGKTWGAIMGLPPASEMTAAENKMWHRRMIPTYITSFVLSIVTVLMLITFVGPYSYNVWSILLATAFIWLGFVMPIVAGGALWSGKPRSMAWKMFWITAGYQFVAFMISALLVAWWL